MPGKKFTTYLNEDLIKELKKLAIDKEISVSQIFNDLATAYIEKEKLSKDKTN